MKLRSETILLTGFWSTLVVPLLLPILDRNLTTVLLWSTTMSIVGVVTLITKAYTPPKIPKHILISGIVLMACTVFSTLSSIVPSISVWGVSPRFIGLMWYALIAIALVCVLSPSILLQKDTLAKTLQYSAVFISTLAILEFFGISLNSLLWNTDPFLGRTLTVFDRPATVAQWLLLTLPLTWIYVKRTSVEWLLMIIGFLAILTTGSRAALLGYFTIFGFFTITKIRWKPAYTIAGLCSFAIIGFVLLQHSRFTLESGIRSIVSRIHIWEASVTAITARPFGYGPATAEYAIQPHLSPAILQVEPVLSYVDKAHSIVFDSLLSLGIVGTIALIVFMYTVLHALLHKRSTAAKAYAAGLIGLLVCSLVDFIGAPILMLLSMVVALAIREVSKKTDSIGKHYWIIALSTATLLSIFATFSFIKWSQAEVWDKRTLGSSYYSNKYTAYKLEQITQTWPYDPQLYHSSIEFAIRNSDNFSRKYIEEQINDGLALTNQQDAYLQSLYGLWLATTGNSAQSIERFTTAKTLSPTNASVLLLEIEAAELINDQVWLQKAKNELHTLLPS